jgi:hypothetical protein
MAFDSAMQAQEAAVSSETAISCLILLSTQFGAQVDTENVRSRHQLRGATLSMSELIELASDFSLKAVHIRRDWPWLQRAVGTRPILLLLKNGNTIVTVGPGRTGAEEIVVCDPLHRGGTPIILSRGNIERAWNGDTVEIMPNSATAVEILESGRDEVFSEDQSNRVKMTPWSSRLRSIILCLSFMVSILALTTSQIAELPVNSQRPGSVMPAIVPVHKSSFANRAGHWHASNQAADAPLSWRPRRPESPIVAFFVSVAQLTTELNVTHPVAESPPAREGPRLSVNSTLSAIDVAALLTRGDDQLRLGDFTSARLFYKAAADAGDADAALRLGETFDPIFIDRANLRGVSADMGRAVFWYLRARDLGSSAAEKLLKDLPPNMAAQIRNGASPPE